MKKSKHQHYVPRFYLRNFSHQNAELNGRSDMIYRGDKKSREILELSIADAAVARNLYTDAQLKNPYQWEDQFGKHEKEAAKILQEIIAKSRLFVTRDGDIVIGKDVRKFLADMIVVQMLRTPKTLNKLQQMCDEQTPYILDFLKQEIVPRLPKDMQQNALDYKISDSLTKNVKLQAVLDAIEKGEIANQMMKKTWTIYRLINPNARFNFLTSDHPVVISDVSGQRFNIFESPMLSPLTIISYPLAPDILLSIYGGQERKLPTDGKITFLSQNKEQRFVDSMNQLQIKQCERYVFGKW